MTAQIGALRVDLGINTASFAAGLKKAETSLGRFGKMAGIGLAAVATGAAAAGTAMAMAVKGAVDYADAIDDASQKTGVAAEVLSRLAYVAKIEGVGLDGLSAGLTRLAKSMSDVAEGSTGPAATAFEALGISITDATGQLRGADQVFVDIAARFGAMEDGATKTALAMAIFGKAGAELIPTLNYGADGLARMAAESDRFGQTVSSKTAAAAGEFNDSLTRLNLAFEGVALQIAEAALPYMQDFADLMSDPDFQRGVVLTTQLIGGLADILAKAAAYAAALADVLPKAVNQGEDAWVNENLNPFSGIADPVGDGAGTFDDFRRQLEGRDPPPIPLPPGARPPSVPTLNMPTFGGSAGADMMAARLDNLRMSLMTEEQLEADSHAKRLAEIASFYEKGLIARGEYDELTEAAQGEHHQRMVDLAREGAEEESRIRQALLGDTANLFGSLSRLAEQFGERGLATAKAFGVAEAVVNTAKGITAALSLPPPASWLQAAAVAASGAAQISTILSASRGSASTPSVRGTGGGVASAGPAAAPQQGVNITLVGDRDTPTTLGKVEDMLASFQEHLGTQGKQLVITYKGA